MQSKVVAEEEDDGLRLFLAAGTVAAAACPALCHAAGRSTLMLTVAPPGPCLHVAAQLTCDCCSEMHVPDRLFKHKAAAVKHEDGAGQWLTA